MKTVISRTLKTSRELMVRWGRNHHKDDKYPEPVDLESYCHWCRFFIFKIHVSFFLFAFSMFLVFGNNGKYLNDLPPLIRLYVGLVLFTSIISVFVSFTFLANRLKVLRKYCVDLSVLEGSYGGYFLGIGNISDLYRLLEKETPPVIKSIMTLQCTILALTNEKEHRDIAVKVLSALQHFGQIEMSSTLSDFSVMRQKSCETYDGPHHTQEVEKLSGKQIVVLGTKDGGVGVTLKLNELSYRRITVVTLVVTRKTLPLSSWEGVIPDLRLLGDFDALPFIAPSLVRRSDKRNEKNGKCFFLNRHGKIYSVTLDQGDRIICYEHSRDYSFSPGEIIFLASSEVITTF